MANDKYDLLITSASPITVRAVAMVKGQIAITEIACAELKLLVERAQDKTYHFSEIIARLEKRRGGIG